MIVYKKQSEWIEKAYEIFSSYENAIIVGKGVSFRSIKKPNEKTLLIGINHAVNKITNPDMVFIQDWPYWKKVNKESRKVLKFAVTPQHSLSKGNYRSGIGPAKIAIVIKDYFDGSILPFKHLDSPDGSYKHLKHEHPKFWGSGYRALVFTRAYLPNLKRVDSYGIAKGNGYHPIFREPHVFAKYKSKEYLAEHRQLCKDVFSNTAIKYVLH